MKLSKGTKEAIQFALAGVVLIAGIALVFISLFMRMIFLTLQFICLLKI